VLFLAALFTLLFSWIQNAHLKWQHILKLLFCSIRPIIMMHLVGIIPKKNRPTKIQTNSFFNGLSHQTFKGDEKCIAP
jgi:hypothetical protein